MDSEKNLVSLSHEWVKARLTLGNRAIDATAGNGNDTLFLSQCVGKSGHVAAFDIQERAIVETRELLTREGCKNVEVFQRGHEKMIETLGSEWVGATQAILFNLGYLPRSDKEITTRIETTLPALEASRTLLSSGGILVVTVYTKHAGGFEESVAVDKWLSHCGAEKILRQGWHNPETPWLAGAIF